MAKKAKFKVNAVPHLNSRGRLALSNSFPRERNPKTGARMEVFVCEGGHLLREDMVQLRKSDGKPTLRKTAGLTIIDFNSGANLNEVLRQNKLNNRFELLYPGQCIYHG